MVNINCMCKYLEEKSLIYYYYLTKCIKWRVWQPFWFLWWQYLYHNKQVRMAFNQQKCFVKKTEGVYIQQPQSPITWPYILHSSRRIRVNISWPRALGQEIRIGHLHLHTDLANMDASRQTLAEMHRTIKISPAFQLGGSCTRKWGGDISMELFELCEVSCRWLSSTSAPLLQTHCT